MKFLTPTPGVSDDDERKSTDALRASLRQRGYDGPGSLPPELRNAMLVRTNETIDRLSTGRALSFSWAMRVAIPGVVAIIAFFAALKYYGTPVPERGNEVAPLLAGLADAQMDSVFDRSAAADSSAVLAAAGAGLFEVSSDGAAEFLLEHDGSAVVLETMTDAEVDQVLAALGSSSRSF